jgi:hypothetical protein
MSIGCSGEKLQLDWAIRVGAALHLLLLIRSISEIVAYDIL